MKTTAALCLATLAAFNGPAFASDKPAPQVSIQTPPPLVFMPQASPAKLDFGIGHDGESKTLTVTLTCPANGEVAGVVSDPDFHIVEIRSAAGAVRVVTAPASPGGLQRATQKTSPPFSLHVSAGMEVRLDVAYAPKTGGNPSRDAALTLTGPGPMVGWTVKVPLHGIYVPPALVNMPAEIRIIEPASTLDLPVIIDGTDHDIVGRFSFTEQPGNVSFPDVPVSVPKGKRVTTKLPLTLTNNWFDAGYKPGGYLKFVFKYDQASIPVLTNLKAYRKSNRWETNWYADAAPKCDGIKSSAFVVIRPEGMIDLQFAWDATSYSEDPSKAVLVKVLWKGQPLAEGIYPRTQQSTLYFKGVQPTRFRTTYKGSEYTNVVDDQLNLKFSCTAVPSSTLF